ncbi:DBR1-domain-containing protein [Delitschia confertaspora ATCC 74209]|uniref:DBR1-domain-containing protein n=1 Tax=Delitschia confertaspora ATCC 74209 TaxID=1513339 RepID=A0A9P4JKY9_9PLEO|nr:DBR1-domain-containing protein [Delitschia confertaspora ATCC 74209]
MDTPVVEKQGLRVAVEGCGHGTLHAIYASVQESCRIKGWDGVDLLIIGGDFQSVRNAQDLNVVAMPAKFREMQDFHEYYSGARTAPYLTIFIGGNHEASNYLWELYYGGWVAPKIYYMGAANVVHLGPLRIAGFSGIWKGYSYRKPHHERLPYSEDDIRNIYHVRELDIRKLLQIRSQVDIGLSHDWPRGMEWKGNYEQLFRHKPYFVQEAKDGTLGSIAAAKVLERLRPAHWFSAHLHTKYAAVWKHNSEPTGVVTQMKNNPPVAVAKNEDEIDLDLDLETQPPSGPASGYTPRNPDEIDLDIDLETPAPAGGAPGTVPSNPDEIDLGLDDDPPQQAKTASADNFAGEAERKDGDDASTDLADVIKSLPDAFQAATDKPRIESNAPSLPFPADITNKTTRFLALDKCMPNRHFLQLLEIEPLHPAEFQRPVGLEYDKEWLAITRAFANDLQVGDPHAEVPADKGDAYYRPLIEKEMEWVENNLVQTGKMAIPEDFQQTAPVFDEEIGIPVGGQPAEYTNPHTQAFCDLLQIKNPFHASKEERLERMQRGPAPSRGRDRPDRGGRGDYRGGGRGRGRGGGGGRGRGSFNTGRGGRGRGRWMPPIR